MYQKLHMTAAEIGDEPNKVMIAPEYMLWLLYTSGKPMNENLLLKKMNEAKIDRRGHPIAKLLDDMAMYGITQFERGKGWKLSAKAIKLIESFKPGSEVDYSLIEKPKAEVVAEGKVEDRHYFPVEAAAPAVAEAAAQ